jgi:DNA-binding NarL/FixJ family response regulator
MGSDDRAPRTARVSPDARDDGVTAPEPALVRVVVVDDQEVFRRAVRELIRATPGFEQVGEAASGPEALRVIADRRPDLVLLDVRMPVMDGLETARLIAAASLDTVVVLVSLDAVCERPEDVGAAALVRKQELSTRALREVWAAHGMLRPHSG